MAYREVLCLATEEARQSRWGFAPDSLQSADVGGDGQTGLGAASHARGTVSVVWGADGTLGGAATTWSIAASVAGLAVADVDGDGRLDVVTAAPQQTIFSAKRLMGKSYHDVKDKSVFYGYKIIDDNSENLVKVQVAGKFYSPIELSAFILKELKQRAEHILKTPVTRAVITVPAYSLHAS